MIIAPGLKPGEFAKLALKVSGPGVKFDTDTSIRRGDRTPGSKAAPPVVSPKIPKPAMESTAK